MGSIDYRLGEIRIKESIVGDLSWEAHFGFGEYRVGGCFLKDGLLILGGAKGEGIGFLKGEFLDNLRKLPPWTRTDYFCLIDDIVSCGTGQPATDVAVRRWCELSGNGEVAGTPLGESAVTAYRLGKHRITTVQDGSIRYQTYIGRDRLVTGEACLVAGILFLNRTETVPAGGDKDRFLAELKQLPVWNQTEFFSFADQLKECRAANVVPPAMGRGRRILAGTRPARVPRKEDRISKNWKPGPSIDSGMERVKPLLANLVAAAVIILKFLMVMIGRAARAFWPLLIRSSQWAGRTIRNRLRKN